MLKLNNKTNKHVHTKYIICITAISLFITSTLLIASSITYNSTSAVSYQSSNNIQFNINPTISISISGDSNGNLSIANLVPGSVSDSNIITVTAESNAVSGYTLSSTVGTSTNTSNELRKDGIDTTNKFTGLSTNQTSLADFSDNEWGYSYSTDSGSIWISGDIDSSSTGYNGYTYTTESQSITHLNTSIPGSSTIKYKIGARAANNQVAGNYTNTINFTAITKPNPEVLDKTFDEAFLAAGKTKYNGYYTMQDMDRNICAAVKLNETVQLIDTRDDTVYYVGKAKDYNCWMLQNLKLGKKTNTLALTSETSNVSADGFTLDGKLTDGKFTYETVDGIEYQNNSSEYYCTNNYGCYYNWHTATAGFGATNISTDGIDVKYSICPANWVLPAQPQFLALYEQYNTIAKMLVDAPATTKENSTGKIPGFLLSGHYDNSGSQLLGSYGYYWSSTARSAMSGYAPYLGTPRTNLSNFSRKYFGNAVRCLAQ